MRFPAENLNLEARRINSDSKSQANAGLQQGGPSGATIGAYQTQKMRLK
jgi:hypothetical protein